jgi:uncharacterized protein YndB with AHSA1/START domain
MTTDTGAFDFHRQMPLSPDQLWHVVTDADLRGQWTAPSEGMTLNAKITDLSVGGIERHVCGPADSPEFEVETRWYRLDGPNDAAYTETVEIGGSAIATNLVTYRIAATETGSELFVHVAVTSFCGPEAASEFKAGWENGLQNLDALIQMMPKT